MQLSTIARGSAVMLVLTLVSWRAEAADRYAMTCLENKTSVTLNYSTRWGPDGHWKRHSLSPGDRIAHAWPYAQGHVGHSPDLVVKFDDNLSGQTKWRERTLESYRAPQETDCRYGRKYHFHYDGSAKKYIDVVSVK